MGSGLLPLASAFPSTDRGVPPLIVALVSASLGAAVVAVVALLLRRRAVAEARREAAARSAARIAELRAMTGGLAHEIKNPLSTLVLNAQLLREEVLDMDLEEEARQRVSRRVETLSREAGRLGDILEDFLRYAGRVQLDRQPRDLREILDELVDFFRPQAEQAGTLLRVDAPHEPVVSLVDAGLLKQALLNLMLNAVQAMERSERRELLLRLEHGRHGAAGEARIHVIDTGPGIAPERRETLFLPYSSTRPGGTGLGLATTRRIVEEHGGRVTLFSEPGMGSDFVLHVPLGDPQASGGGANAFAAQASAARASNGPQPRGERSP
ncbi:MAG: HAMP domain-containing histidine kinase [Phycisphaerae bacterium]|nr:HAMP domain-containing histidine kinase [Phycisphaerae bacterium]